MKHDSTHQRRLFATLIADVLLLFWGLGSIQLVEQDHAAAIAAIADCKVKQMQPYLKRHHALFIFGFGGACAKR